MKPTMIVLAGPNGAGKSTLYETRVAPSFAGPFINADIIQRDELRDPSPAASYEAAEIASSRRADLLARGRDFVTETVFSHPSKLELIDEARNRGFTVIVMHVGVDTPELSVARVGTRVEGSHFRRAPAARCGGAPAEWGSGGPVHQRHGRALSARAASVWPRPPHAPGGPATQHIAERSRGTALRHPRYGS